ncbi:MAG TPA: TIGR03118 family protein [Tepidisphaeraceae bacterium]|nr:TIGR03118 family protein [Tepidisphaeraceae bacterium]
MRLHFIRAAAQAEKLEPRRLLSGGGHHAHQVVIEAALVSDGAISAPLTDPNLVNPWGITSTPGSPFWIADNAKGLATLHDGAGDVFSRIVTVPGATNPSTPTGIVFNGSIGFDIGQGSSALPGRFIFVTQDGAISAWNKNLDPTNAFLAVNNSSSGSVFTGAALADVGGGALELFVADFHNAAVDVFDDTFAPVQITGGFHDPKIPAGYAPYNIQDLNNKLYVTYAKQDSAGHNAVAAAGKAYVDVFDVTGHLLQRFQRGSFLNAPWGMAIAPANWGTFAGNILVAQTGSGRVDVFNAKNGHFINYLPMNAAGKPLVIPGLRGLIPGDSVNAGDTSTVYFTADPNTSHDGLLGALNFTVTIVRSRNRHRA